MDNAAARDFNTQSSGSSLQDFNISQDQLPFVIAGGALLVGFVIGSGRWQVLSQTGTRLLSTFGSLIVNQAIESLRQQPVFQQFESSSK